MSLQNNITWFFAIFAFVALFTGGSVFFGDETSIDMETIQFSELSNADMDLIMSVKDEMDTIKTQAY